MLVPSQILHSEAKQAGSLANPALFSKQLCIIALFENSLYMEGTDGKLFCLCNEILSLGPLSILCSHWKQLRIDCLHLGQTSTFKDSSLILHSNAVINFANVQNTCSPDIPLHNAQTIAASLRSLQVMLPSKLCCSTGFAPLLPLFISDLPIENQDIHALCGGDIFLQEALRSIAAFVRCFDDYEANKNIKFTAKAITDLIGLGPGLTPSGDDFIVGAMLALRYCKCFSLVDALVEVVCTKHVSSLTNKISYAYLQAAALGHVSSVLYDAANDFCVHSSQLRSSLQRLALVGHSSGWDAFTGFVITMKAVSPK